MIEESCFKQVLVYDYLPLTLQVLDTAGSEEISPIFDILVRNAV